MRLCAGLVSLSVVLLSYNLPGSKTRSGSAWCRVWAQVCSLFLGSASSFLACPRSSSPQTRSHPQPTPGNLVHYYPAGLLSCNWFLSHPKWAWAMPVSTWCCLLGMMPHLIMDSNDNWGWTGPLDVLLLRPESAFKHPGAKHRHCRLTLNTSADTFCYWR